MSNEANQPNVEEESLRKPFIPDIETAIDDSPKNDRPADLDALANPPEAPETIRTLFVPEAETAFSDSPKNDRPADLDTLADAPQAPEKIRKPVDIDEQAATDDPRSPKNTDRGSES